MNYTFLFTWISLFAGFLLLVLIIGTIRFSKSTAKNIAILLFSSLSLYCFSYAFELQNFPLEVTLRIIGIEYIGISLAPVFLLLFIIRFQGLESNDIRNILPYLLFIPLVTIIITWTDLVIPYLYIEAWMNSSSLVPGFAMIPGTWWYIITIWNLFLLVACLFILLKMLLKPGFVHQKQVFLMAIGIIAPIFGIFLNTYARSIIPVDFTPITLVITGIALYPAITSYNLFDIIPIAYATIFTKLGSGIIVLDDEERIRDINIAAEKIFHVSKNSVIGDDIRSVFPPGVMIPDYRIKSAENRKEITLSWDGRVEYYLFDQMPLSENPKTKTGSVFVFTCITDLKEKEEQLKEYTSIIEKRNKDIQTAIREKEVLLREIHHRVKNNMQVISSLLSIHVRNIKDPNIQTQIKDIQVRIKSLGLVHELLYLSENLNKINYHSYLEKITGYFLQSYEFPDKKIRCVINVDDIEITIDKAVPLSLIISELLTNSFKHAFSDKDNGEIIISFRFNSSDNFYILDYRDDGKGINTGIISDQKHGIGSSLIVGLTRQLSGTVRKEDGKPGVHYTVMFPGEEL